MKRKILTAAALWVFSSGAASAVDYTQPGDITAFKAGWRENQLRVQLDAPFVQAACTKTDGYMTDKDDGGADLFHAALMTAITTGRKVILTLDGCAVNRPKIIGVEMVL